LGSRPSGWARHDLIAPARHLVAELKCRARAHRLAVTILIDADNVTVTHRDTASVLSEHTIDLDRSYWRNQHKQPGRWPAQNPTQT
jgi:hypothetical protein